MDDLVANSTVQARSGSGTFLNDHNTITNRPYKI